LTSSVFRLFRVSSLTTLEVDRYTLVETASRNGTYLNRHPVRTAAVFHDGDEFAIGPVGIGFHTPTNSTMHSAECGGRATRPGRSLGPRSTIGYETRTLAIRARMSDLDLNLIGKSLA
jgi:pSer/pThr/pTyr-binding forkhead associated (FHA) protein